MNLNQGTKALLIFISVICLSLFIYTVHVPADKGNPSAPSDQLPLESNRNKLVFRRAHEQPSSQSNRTKVYQRGPDRQSSDQIILDLDRDKMSSQVQPVKGNDKMFSRGSKRQSSNHVAVDLDRDKIFQTQDHSVTDKETLFSRGSQEQSSRHLKLKFDKNKMLSRRVQEQPPNRQERLELYLYSV